MHSYMDNQESESNSSELQIVSRKSSREKQLAHGYHFSGFPKSTRLASGGETPRQLSCNKPLTNVRLGFGSSLRVDSSSK